MIDGTRVTLALFATLWLAGSAQAGGDAARGEAKFADCAACHKLDAGANEVGPSLHAIFNRKAGEIAEFRYSPAMKRSGITWTPQTLADFVADPQKAVPNNRMPFAGMPDAAERADLVAYLEKASK
jgi:cytochrome c